MEEQFKNIENFSKYQISNLGNVKSLWNNTEKILNTVTNKNNGYVYIGLKDDDGNRKTLSVHRLVAKNFVDNPDNKNEVDHIDGNKINNNVNNLRWSTHTENNRNKAPQRNNTSGYSGITWMTRKNKWRVRIKVDKKELHLGLYSSFDDAVRVRKEKEKEYFKGFTYGGSIEEIV